MRPKTLPILVFFNLFFTSLFAQKEWSNWYYNRNNLLTFKNGYPELIKDFITPAPSPTDYYNFNQLGSGGVSYSDPVTGEMKFIISRSYGFNKNYEMFPSHTTLNNCDIQNGFHIIPFHNNPNKFYVVQFQDISRYLISLELSGLQVRCPNIFGVGYSIVDLELDGGLGDFTVTNQILYSTLTAQMTTVKHENGNDVWVIVHPYNTDKFLSYLFTDSGIDSPVESTIGPLVAGKSEQVLGHLRASHDGRLLVGAAGLYSGQAKEIQFFDFDKSTGKLSDYRTVPFNDYLNEIEFSPDDSKLYCLGGENLYQYDLNNTDFASTRTLIIHQPNGLMMDMKTGLDGKIYINKTTVTESDDAVNEYLGIIQCPNLPQYACNFEPKGISLRYSMVNFPNLINDYIIDPKAPAIQKFDIGKDTSICFGEYKISAPAGWESYRWNTGETTQEITVKQPGIYYVLTGNTGFSCPEGYGYIDIGDAAIKLDLGPDTLLCPKTPYPIHISNEYTNILWNNGSSVRDTVITSNSTFIISATDKNGCFTKDTISVNYFYYPAADFGADTTLCANETLVLQMEPRPGFGQVADFLWQDGSSGYSYKVTQPGLYWGQSTYNGCTVRDSIYVDFLSPLQVSLGNDTTLCTGDSLRLSLNVPNVTYKWSTGETDSSITIKNAGDYWVELDNGICTMADTIRVNFQDKIKLFSEKDTAVCSGQPVVLNPLVNNATFLWQDGSTNQQLEAKNEGLYWVNANVNGCVSRDSITISYKPLPDIVLGKDTTICSDQNLLLDVSSISIVSYLWQDNSTASTFPVTKSGIYSVTVTDSEGCSNSDTIHVQVTPVPSFNLGRDTTLCDNNSLHLQFNLPETSYLWNDGITGNSMTITSSGMYWLKAEANGCSKSDTILVNFNPTPAIHLGNDTTLCERHTWLLNANYPGATYLWNDGTTSPVKEITQAGRYIVQVALNKCFARDTIEIKYLNKPRFISASDTAICIGQTLSLKPKVSGADISYQWQNGSGFPELNIVQPGIYNLTIRNLCGTASQVITVSQGICELFLPNAFTPNNDGLNDLFRIKYPGFIKNFEMVVYNKFGQVIFKTTDPYQGWNGTYKGEPQPAGTYVWMVKLINLQGEKKSAKGTVTLTR